MRSATATELLEILRDRQDELRTRLNDPTVQLSMPVDEGDCRLLAMMRTDHHMTIIFEFDIGDELVRVPIELVDQQEPQRCRFFNEIQQATQTLTDEIIQRQVLETRLQGEITRLERLLADVTERVAKLESH